MKHIAPPRRTDRYPDRDIDCQEAIEAEFQRLVQDIAAAGWGPSEIAEAIENLAMADKMARIEGPLRRVIAFAKFGMCCMISSQQRPLFLKKVEANESARAHSGNE